MNNTQRPLLRRALLALALLLALLPPLAAEDAPRTAELAFTAGGLTCLARYPVSVEPGDPVYVRLRVTGDGAPTATLRLSEKNTAQFYPVPSPPGAPGKDYLAGVPLSTWYEGTTATLTVTVTQGKDVETATLPLTVTAKDYPKYTLKLDAANTARMTDSSPTRVAQSDRLNELVLSRRLASVYQAAPFSVPTTITRITDRFGARRIYEYSDGKTRTSEHYGKDFGAPTGTPVFAAAAGRVGLAENRIQTGWSVIIEHLPGLFSLYYHMDRLDVKEGDLVQAGDPLGLSGATGIATGPHLHWEMRLHAVAVNPDAFLGDFTHLTNEQ
jgi:murein DD-endopeptidase MepM/ murein hydrolase activator NlpD